MEGKINCTSCGNEVVRGTQFCPSCGQQLMIGSEPSMRTPKSGKKVVAVIISIVVAVIVIIAMALALSGLQKPSNGDGGNGTRQDTDGDGYPDDEDDFPNDPTEWKDSDGDGYGDNGDEFPNDPDEWRDRDGDGHGDNEDEFPNDPDEWRDSDGDGVGNNQDDFPYDPTEWRDSDNDGHGDNSDEYPYDSSEWRDSDSDGVGDNADFYDHGNGGIKVKVTYIAVTTDCDFWSACDPYFEFRVDKNNDGNYESTKTSAVTQDRNVISNPLDAYYIVDIPDGISKISFCIIAYDSDVSGYEVIDYTPGGDFAYCHTVLNPFSDSWSYSGSSPSGPYYARLDYTISVVSMG